MPNYVPIYAEIVDMDSQMAQKVLARYELLDELAEIVGIPPELWPRESDLDRLALYAQNIALEVDGSEGSENAGKT
jgi:hypothetical protein